MDVPCNRFLPTIQWVRWAIAPSLIFIAACLDRGYQTDFWHHLARGREIVRSGRILDIDLFTFTIAGQPIRDVNWLTQVIYYRLFQWGGLSLVQVGNALILAASVLVLVRLCRLKSGSLPAAAAAGVAFFLGIWQLLLIRPQSFSLLLFTLLYWALTTQSGVAILFISPLIMMAWVNLHGGFAIGLVLLAAMTLAEVLKHTLSPGYRGEGSTVAHRRWSVARYRAAAFLLGIIATLANPYGWNVYRYVGQITSRATSRHLEEWLPPAINMWVGQAFVLSMIGLIALYLLAKRRPTIEEIVLIICFLPLAGHSVRMVAWWWIVIAPSGATLLAQALSKPINKCEPRPTLSAAALSSLLLASCCVSLPWLSRWNPLFGPVRSDRRIEADLQTISSQLPHGRLFARLEWGDYLTWSLGPEGRLYIDGRVEAYPDSVWRDYCAISSAQRDWESILGRDHIDSLLLDEAYHDRLLEAVRRSPRWHETARSGSAVLFVRYPADGGLAGASPVF